MTNVTESGQSLGTVAKTAVKNMAVPAPSTTRSKIHAKMKPQVEGSEITNL